MVIRYTPEEWAGLGPARQELRLDLAPDGVAEEWAARGQRFLNSESDSLSVLAEGIGALLTASDKARRVIEYYQEAGADVSKEDFVAFIEQQNFTALDVAELVNMAVNTPKEQRRKAGQAKNTNWLPAIIELYLKYGRDYPTVEAFCDDYAGAQVSTEGESAVKAPKAETIRKQLTAQAIGHYEDQLAVKKRRGGIS